ncbi:hypothetical protein KJ780_02185 [Candidatus Micrarchaeota archaeon]|nr:hypothetical protein [Candidatus Micrarchaeota archaeon]
MDWLKGIGIGVMAAVGGFVVVMLGILALFIFAIFGALMGAITGFILQIVPILGPLVKQGFMILGIENPDLVAIGAALGFVAGFFKNSFTGGSCKSD